MFERIRDFINKNNPLFWVFIGFILFRYFYKYICGQYTKLRNVLHQEIVIRGYSSGVDI